MEYLTLSEYTEFASKLILKKMGFRYLTDENIGHVVNYIANADKTYKEGMGTKRSTFRMICGLHGVRCLKRLKNKRTCLSLNFKAAGLSRGELSDVIEDKRFSKKEKGPSLITEVVNNSNLTSKEHLYITKYLDGYKFNEIAAEMGVTKQAISYTVNKAINKMKAIYGPA